MTDNTVYVEDERPKKRKKKKSIWDLTAREVYYLKQRMTLKQKLLYEIVLPFLLMIALFFIIMLILAWYVSIAF